MRSTSAQALGPRLEDVTAQVLRQGEGLGSEERLAVDPGSIPRPSQRVSLRGQRTRRAMGRALSGHDSSKAIGKASGSRLATRRRRLDDRDRNSIQDAIVQPEQRRWGINFERAIQRKDEILGWVSRNRTLNPGVAGTATGLRDLEQGSGARRRAIGERDAPQVVRHGRARRSRNHRSICSTSSRRR